MSLVHRRNNSNLADCSGTDDIGKQIDRLNLALQIAMQEIEAGSSSSRVPSRFSVVNSEFCFGGDVDNISVQSDDLHLPIEFEQKIEELIQTIDRDKMIIEDMRSNEVRRYFTDLAKTNLVDAEIIRSEIELSVKIQKNVNIEKEKKNFEEKLNELDMLKEEYIKKKNDVVNMHQKLIEKETLLVQKEKELRASRIAFDRHKLLWEQNHGSYKETKENFAPDDPDMPTIKAPRSKETALNPLRSSMPVMTNLKSLLSNPLTDLSYEIKKNGAPRIDTDFSSLDLLQEELKNKEADLTKLSTTSNMDTSKLEVQIDQLKNRIATLRGKKVMYESSQTTKLMSTIVQSIQKQSKKEESVNNRNELLERMKRKENSQKSPMPETDNFKLKQLDSKIQEPSETTKRFLFSDAPTPRGIITPRSTPRTTEKDDPYRIYFDNKKKLLQEKERELMQKETMLQETWMKLPGAKELIENVNMMLGKVAMEKTLIEGQREEFEKERLEFLRSKEKFVAAGKKGG
ncbi:hypothetical protein SteCoe_37707 [Stentor coeruleus]|uniref:Uncharacterized protein n=1 Tax=Stentor coeruleus TaxID=5963 RepID=A0A1R2AMG4_9CILI|nr:hypothetical protein SteCoe_37707 [Stentor coeruleus]